jgi:threonine synthase
MWKAFDELEALGWIDERRPRLISAQTVGCAPVVEAFEQGADRMVAWKAKDTRAAGLRVPKPYADRIILRALRDCRGGGVRVTGEAIRHAECDMAEQEGILVCPEGPARLAGLRELVARNAVVPEERIVRLNTGMEMKYLQ